MRKLLLPLFILIFNISFAEKFSSSFEGKIILVKESVFDTTYITVLVKGSKARVEEHDKQNRHVSTRLVDLEELTVVALSPERKLFTNVQVGEFPKLNESKLTIRKTDNSKEINGYTCYQWRVRDPERNTEVAYWVVNERFDFFERLIQLLNRTEHSLVLYQVIPDKGGFFPILTEERTLLRKDKLKIAVLEITETNLNPRQFEIPQGYLPLRN